MGEPAPIKMREGKKKKGKIEIDIFSRRMCGNLKGADGEQWTLEFASFFLAFEFIFAKV